MRNRFKGWVKGLFGVDFGVAGADTWQFAQEWLKGLMKSSEALDEPYRQHSTIANAVGSIAEDAAAVGWEMHPRGDDEALESHPFLDALDRPSDMCSGIDHMTLTVVCYQVFGECFWYYPDLDLGRTGGARVLERTRGEILILDPRRVRHRITNGVVSWSLTRGVGEPIPLDSRALTWFRRVNPYGFRGLSKIQALMIDAGADHSAAQWNERFFSEQNGIPSGVLSPAQGSNLTPDQRADLRRTYMQRHGGTKRNVLITPAGWTFQAIGMSQLDMGFRELRGYSDERILGFFGYPPFMAGILDKANYANAREQKGLYWNGTQTRLLRSFASTINSDMLPKLGITDARIRPDWSYVKGKTEDLGAKSETAERLFKIGFTRRTLNERLELGFDLSDDETADVSFLPVGMLPAEQAAAPPAPIPPALAPGEPEDEEQNGQRRWVHAIPKAALPPADEERRALVWRNLIARTRDMEAAFDSTMRSHIQGLRKEVLGKVNGAAGLAASLTGSVTKQNDQLLFDLEEANGRLLRRTRPLHRRAVRRGGESIVADLALDFAFDLDAPLVVAKLAEMSENIVGFNERLEFRLRTILTDAFDPADPQSMREIAEKISHEFDVTMARSRTIARTEVGFGFNSGRNLSMRQAGITKHEWLSSRDPDVRDTHTAEDGNSVQVGEPFPVTGLQYPNDPSGPASEVINCRCVALPVVR